MSSPPAPLGRRPDFLKLWLGQTVSEFGSRITRDGLPILAVSALAATPQQMGLLSAAASLPVLILSLFAGVWVDRLRRRPLLIAADLGRAAVLMLIPIAALSGHLTFGLALAVIMAANALSLFFNISYNAMLPWLVERERLLEANSKLATTDALAEVGGPAIAGLLIQAIGAPLAIAVDAASFVFSAVTLAAIRKPEPRPERHPSPSVRREMREGVAVILADPLLRALTASIALRAFFGSMIGALYALFTLRELGLTPGALGIVIATGGIGSLIGAALAHRLTRRYGLKRTLAGSLLLSSCTGLLLPLAEVVPGTAILTLIAGQIIGDAGMAIFLIGETSLRQITVPNALLGRANALTGFLAEGVAPLGALIGGAIAGAATPRLGLAVAVGGILATAIGLVWALSRQSARANTTALEG
ncbi:MAG: MFS transporter [Anaerolineae bacterium]